MNASGGKSGSAAPGPVRLPSTVTPSFAGEDGMDAVDVVFFCQNGLRVFKSFFDRGFNGLSGSFFLAVGSFISQDGVMDRGCGHTPAPSSAASRCE